jgi:hypothetical protein
MDLMTWLRNQWDRASAAVLIFIGLIALVVGWVGVSGTGLTAEQIPYVLSGGLGGIFLLGLGAMLWLSADMRDEWRAVTELRQAIDRSAADVPRDREADTTALSVEAPLPAQGSSNGDEPSRRPLRSGR